MENNGESNSRNGSFRLGLGLGLNEAKVHTIVELFGFDTQSLLLNSVDVNGGGTGNGGEEREKEQKVPTNSLSPRQMKSLVALCDTILPSIKDNVVGADDDVDESVANFYLTSASMAGTPERVGLTLPIAFKVFSSSPLPLLAVFFSCNCVMIFDFADN